MSIHIRDEFSEAYEVVRILDLVHGHEIYRIEIVRVHRGGSKGDYQANYYVHEDGRWRDVVGILGDVPGWVANDDLEKATQQAQSFLSLHLENERRRKPAEE